MAASLHLDQVGVTFPGRRPGEEVVALEDINLTIEAGSFVVVVVG